MAPRLRAAVVFACLLGSGAAPSALAQAPIEMRASQSDRVTIVARDASLREVFEMLSRKERVNILIGNGLDATVSLNLYDVSLDRAIRGIADAAGFVAERRRTGYVIVERGEAGRDAANGNTILKALEIHYSDPIKVSDILSKHLSRYGEVTVFEDRGFVVVEDLPDFVRRIEGLLAEIDRVPRQILIEAKILEITLDEEDRFGIDWKRIFSFDDGTGSFGTRGLATSGAGFFFDLITPNIEVALNALSANGRVRTLSTPTLVALEHEEAEVVIGDRLGFRVTTTINAVTSETVEFLESGVILRFKASVDREGRILIEVHPEVSTGVISDGLPSQTTTEVTTKLLVENGQKIFIGGLIKDRLTQDHSGVPYLKDIPLLGKFFSKQDGIGINTETVVVMSAHVVPEDRARIGEKKMERLPEVEEFLKERRVAVDEAVDRAFTPPGGP